MLGEAGGGLAHECAGAALARRKGEVDLSQRVRTYLFDRHALIRGRW